MQAQGRNPRPNSGHPQANRNPITGEEMPFSSRAEKKSNRPGGVPQIDLGLLDDDPDKCYYQVQNGANTDRTTVSWGTDSNAWSARSESARSFRPHVFNLPLPPDMLSARKPQDGKQQSSRPHDVGLQTSARLEGKPAVSAQASVLSAPRDKGDGDKKKSHAGPWNPIDISSVPPPSARHKEMYKQYEQEMKENYQKSIQPKVTEDSIREKIEQLKLDIPPLLPSEETDDCRTEVHRDWTKQPYTKATLVRKQDKEDLEEENKKRKLIETVMADQLSRFVVCDPEQNDLLSRRIPSDAPHKKGSLRTLHNTKVKTQGSATENLLAARVRFDVRIQTHSGRDALRDLTGFYFHLDNSLTIYEFRRFGKSGKALPFIKRGIYKHQTGRRIGEHFMLTDIFVGGQLDFECEGQPLPETLLGKSRIRFRITSVDDEAKSLILLTDVPAEKRDEVWKKAHLPPTKEEIQDLLLQQQVQNVVHHQIQKRGVKVHMGLGKRFRSVDEYHDGQIAKFDYEKALLDFKIVLAEEKFDDLWELLDSDNTGFADYRQFTVFFLGEMSERRRSLVRKVFMKMDPGKIGSIATDEFRKFYNTHKHPMVKGGQLREDEALSNFLSAFEDTTTKNHVTFEEFEEYYEGVSVSIASDEEFTNLLRNAWAL